MRTRPEDVADSAVVAAVRAGWDIAATSAAYLPVGFGSHHWRVEGDGAAWFATVDDLDVRRSSAAEPRAGTFQRLRAALRTARALRDAGLAFVVAPLTAIDGDVLQRFGDRYALAVYPFVRVAGHADTVASSDLDALLGRIVDVHAVPPARVPDARTDDFEIDHRDALDAALEDVGRPWSTGPFGEPARIALREAAANLRELLAAHDVATAAGRSHPERFVLTHGEPHARNTIASGEGLLLIDWDTCLLAPPERDLWTLARTDPAIPGAYAVATGRPVSLGLLEFYARAWEFSEIAIYLDLFRQPHTTTDDTELSWAGFAHSMDVIRSWPSP